MKNRIKIFNDILEKLNHAGILDEIILIGNWCQYLYKESKEFSNLFKTVSAIRTMDIDFYIAYVN